MTRYLIIISVIASNAFAANNIQTKSLADIVTKQNYLYPAKVIALNIVNVSSEMAGSVRSQSLKVGEAVKKGQTLITLNCTDLVLQKEQTSAAIKRLNAQKTLSKQQLDRAKKLVKIKSISNQELDERQTSLDAAIASLEQQQVARKIINYSISKCKIKAPFDGIITQSNVQNGLYVTPGSPLLTLLNPNEIEVEANLPLTVPETLFNAAILIFKQNDDIYQVKVRSQLPLVDPVTKLQSVRLSFENEQRPLANSIGQLFWEGEQHYLPPQYIVQRNDQLGVFIARKGTVFFHPLPKAIEGQISEINLPLDTQIISSHLLTLNEGDEL